MKVLTFGWDYPPHTTGGLGFACLGLTRELINEGVEVIFVLPRSQNVSGEGRFIFADMGQSVTTHQVDSEIVPYRGSDSVLQVYDPVTGKPLYSRTLLSEVYTYANKASKIAMQEDFDVIHAHDWTSYLAGVSAKNATGKPLILHVHATSYDQAAGENVDPSIYAIEKRAFETADSVVAISNYVKNTLVHKHGVDPLKITVVHNGSDTDEPAKHEPTLTEVKKRGKKIVLYHGRITIQKGVDYFVRAARKVIDIDPDVVFVISGKGDMSGQIMQMVGAMGLSKHFIFAGDLWYEERDRMYQSADLVVMPSVSEPFGLVPLEATRHGTPSVISKQSGVTEVVAHALKVDFWDVDEMANKIVAALRYPVMRQQLIVEGKRELKGLSWRPAAEKIKHLYNHLVKWTSAHS